MLLFTSVVIVVLVLVLILIYNSLVKMRVQTENAWSDINVQLKRRHDLIPNLVETVKGYASHERETLESVIEARNNAVSASGPAQTSAAEGALSQMLRSLFALSERYPQLRASENFSQLQGSLGQIEGAIQNARRYYNAVVRDYNTRISQVPYNIIANLFGFERREFFELSPEESAVPQVSFSAEPK